MPRVREDLAVIASLSEGVVHARLNEMREHDKLTVALRQFLRNGVSIDDLSAVSGLTPREIKSRCERELYLGEDVLAMSGC